MTASAPAPLRVANCSGFYGDRLSAMREVLEGGPVDVVTGDYLAELTMLILGRQRAKDPAAGYARTFLRQLEECLAGALDSGVKVVSNAGGLNPRGLADAVRTLADRLGLAVRVAVVDGDDLLPRWSALADGGRLVGGETPPTGTGAPAPGDAPLTANAYLGCWGVVRALEAGADVVVTGRVTDASLVVGPAAWHHGWTRDDLDALAGATVAGHLLECGTQVSGGNFSRFADVLRQPGVDPHLFDACGFPLAEVAADGSCVVTKHPGTGGMVTVETVTEQLLYECTGSRYGGPDVVTRFDTLRLTQDGTDRVRVEGARGEVPSAWLKVATNRLGGFRNTMTLPLTGLDVEEKAALLERQLAPALARVAESDVVLARTDHADADVAEEASAVFRVTVKDTDPDAVGRRFSAAVVELGLASVPGFFATTPPGAGTPYGVYAPAWVAAEEVPAHVVLPDGTAETVASHHDHQPVGDGGTEVRAAPAAAGADAPRGPTRRVPLGRVAGARSGDKGGTCTLGVYVRTDEAYAWLADALTADRLHALLPEVPEPPRREELPHLRALLFQLPGLLGEGVAAGTRFDPQGKAVGEWLRARHVDVPVALLDDA